MGEDKETSVDDAVKLKNFCKRITGVDLGVLSCDFLRRKKKKQKTN